MRGSVREAVHYGNAQDNQPQADERGRIKPLTINVPSDRRYENDADPRPNRIRDSSRDLAQRKREKLEGEHVASLGYQARHQPGETLGSLEEHGRRHFFAQDGHGEKEIGHGRSPA